MKKKIYLGSVQVAMQPDETVREAHDSPPKVIAAPGARAAEEAQSAVAA